MAILPSYAEANITETIVKYTRAVHSHGRLD